MAVQFGSKLAKCKRLAKIDYSSDPLDFETPQSTLPSTVIRIPREFTITADSYISLCSRVYAACCAEINEFSDKIPESAFQFYAVILLWKRFEQILINRTEICESEFFNEISQLYHGSRIPSPLGTYLKSIGHFRDPHNYDRKFTLPVFPTCQKIAGIPYTFEKVDSKTHSFYESFPAPGIAALRMVADIKYTKDACDKHLFWDLPEGLRPDVVKSQHDSIQPTKNLLGWAPAQRLTENQLKLFESLKINDSFAQNDYSSMRTSINKLCYNITNHIRQKGRSWYVSFVSSASSMGSLVQGMAIERHEFVKFDRAAMYCEGTISVCSPYNLNEKLAKGAVIAGYRMAKESISHRHCWSCYDFNEYQNVPESWILSRNTVYTHGNTGSLNEKVYVTPYATKRILQNECILYSLKPMQNWNIYL